MEQTSKKANHQANIVRLGEPITHTNADSLEIFRIGGYQVVTRKGEFKAGDFGVYIQPDSVVPQTEAFRFIWDPYGTGPRLCNHEGSIVFNNTVAKCMRCQAVLINGYISVNEKRRRITVRKFRGEWSEGLLMPVSDFRELAVSTHDGVVRHRSSALLDGEDVSDILNITHYDPDTNREAQDPNAVPRPKRRYPKTIGGWFRFIMYKLGLTGRRADSHWSDERDNNLGIPVYDVDSLKNYPNVFKDGDSVIITEKIHGANARFVFIDGTMYAGTRRLWKTEDSQCKWREVLKPGNSPEIERFCRDNEGFTVYGELVPTQKGFDYGASSPRVYVFDIRDAEGYWLPADVIRTLSAVYGLDIVPTLYGGAYSGEVIENYRSGPSEVPGANHIREGIVIKAVPERRVPGLGRAQLKLVSNEFLVKDSKDPKPEKAKQQPYPEPVLVPEPELQAA